MIRAEQSPPVVTEAEPRYPVTVTAPLRHTTAFVGGPTGVWQVVRGEAVRGPALPPVQRVAVYEGGAPGAASTGGWVLRGVASYERYVRREEHEALAARQPVLGRPSARCAALIPIAKSAAWWALAQDERRAILEERSHHIVTGVAYLPAIARRLYHGHDLGEPFDFLTWFEFAPEHANAFEELVERLRATEEWTYVEREVDIRLTR